MALLCNMTKRYHSGFLTQQIQQNTKKAPSIIHTFQSKWACEHRGCALYSTGEMDLFAVCGVYNAWQSIVFLILLHCYYTGFFCGNWHSNQPSALSWLCYCCWPISPISSGHLPSKQTGLLHTVLMQWRPLLTHCSLCDQHILDNAALAAVLVVIRHCLYQNITAVCRQKARHIGAKLVCTTHEGVLYSELYGMYMFSEKVTTIC